MNLTRCFVLRSHITSILRNASTSNLQHRHELTNASKDQSTPWVPWDTSRIESDSELKNIAATLKNENVSRKSVPGESIDQGVSIDKRGQLKVVSCALAERECRTALILSAASTHLTKTDFTRLLPINDKLGPNGVEGALVSSQTHYSELTSGHQSCDPRPTCQNPR